MRNDSVDNFRIELNKPSLRGSFYVRVGDTRARTIHITITDNGKVVDLSDAKICEILIKKSDGNQCDQAMVRVGNELQYTFRTQDINVAGENLCQCMITFNDYTTLTTPTFSVMVYQKEVDQNLEKSTNEYTALSTIVLDVQETQNSINEYVTEKENTIANYEAQAALSATNAANSETVAIAKAEEAEGHAEEASDYADTCAAHVESVAGYAAVVSGDKDTVAADKAIVAADKAIVAGYVDEVTGIAATKADKVNPETSGTFNHTGTFNVDNIAVSDLSLGATTDDKNIQVDSDNIELSEKLDNNNHFKNVDISADKIKLSSDINEHGDYFKNEATLTSEKLNIYSVRASEFNAYMNANGQYNTSTIFRITPLFKNDAYVADPEKNTNYPLKSTLRNLKKSVSELDTYGVKESNFNYDTIGSDKVVTGVTFEGNTSPVYDFDAHLKLAEMSLDVTSLESDVADNTAAIEDLKNKPSSALVLTSASPLATSSASNILGIECEGKSTQDTSIATVQGQVANTSGAINQDLTTNTTRCSSSVMQMVSGVTISVSSGYEIYLMYSASASGNITQKLSWASSQTTSADGYYRLMIRKSDNTTVAPTDFALSQTPTPTNPIAIVDASGVVVAHTINLFDKNDTSKILNAYINGTSKKIVALADNKVVYIECKPNTTYTVSKLNGQRFICGYCTELPQANLELRGVISSATASTITITTDESAKYLVAWVSYSGDGIDATTMLASVQIEQGTTASDYVAYQSNSIYINNCEAQASWVIGSAWDNGSVVGSGIWGRTEKLTIVNNSIHVVCDASMYRLRCSFWNGETYLSQITENDKSEATFTVPTNATHYALSIVKASGTSMTTEYTNMVHIKVVGIINDCLRSIGTVADTLVVKQDGSGVLTKRVGTVDLGTLTWNSASNYYHSSGIADKIRQSTSTSEMPNMICTTLSANTRSATTVKGTNFITVYANGNIVATPTDTPIGTLYYELATPIVTTLTASQVASILALRTYNGTTIVDSEIVKDVTYSADVKGYVDSKCDYSYSDTIIGKWADGKDLHRMVISATTPSTVGINRITNVIKGTDISLKNMYGVIHYDNTHIPLGTYNSSTYYISAYVDESGIEFSNGATKYCNCDCEIIVEYTLNEESAIATLSEVSE